MVQISEQEKAHVLSEIGMCTIRRALVSEGMLIFGQPSIVINWAAAETWAKVKARDYNVSPETLRAIIISYLKERARQEIEKYE